jgi:hypothetical protein
MTAATRPLRKPRHQEVYELVCCGIVQIPVRNVVDNVGVSPCCGQRLQIEWRPATT